MSNNINTQSYWNNRFDTGDWENKGGRLQTQQFAESQVKFLNIQKDFDGTILDFGCGLGDAMPVYGKYFPRAKLVGIDHSEAAVNLCLKKYKNISSFKCGDVDSVPSVDIIISSNVMEHIISDEEIVARLLEKCTELYIFVPYKENPLILEHVNCYDEKSYSRFDPFDVKVFNSRGWSQYGSNLMIDIYLKNLIRPFVGKSIVHRKKQIMFRIKGKYSHLLE